MAFWGATKGFFGVYSKLQKLGRWPFLKIGGPLKGDLASLQRVRSRYEEPCCATADSKKLEHGCRVPLKGHLGHRTI